MMIYPDTSKDRGAPKMDSAQVSDKAEQWWISRGDSWEKEEMDTRDEQS